VSFDDPVVSEFSKSVVQQYAEEYPNLPQPLVYARAIYAAMGMAGLTFQVDQASPLNWPCNSRPVSTRSISPRDAGAQERRLRRPVGPVRCSAGKCGDQDRACPGAGQYAGDVQYRHPRGGQDDDRFPDELVVVYEDAVWIPVDMTQIGTSFSRAWREGARQYRGGHQKTRRISFSSKGMGGI